MIHKGNPAIAISVDNVSKQFKLPHERVTSVKSIFVNPLKSRRGMKTETQYALKDVSFDMKKGEFFGIVGRNGSGKSTLLKLIADIYQPTKGLISHTGRLVPFIELGVGFNPELTGRENVYLNGALMGFSSSEIDEMYEDIVAFAELELFMDQKLKNYSSGMQVRLAFSVATRAKADILLIDEVLAVGDADFQRKCFQYFRMLKKQNVTVVFVSHDMEAVREYCDRCVLIDKSVVIYEGSPEVAAEKYLKLFNSDADSGLPKVQEKNDERWGDGSAKVVEARAIVNEREVKLSMKVLFQEMLESPIIGFSIKNQSGEIICGTNNKIVRKTLGDFQPGDSLELEWSIPNIFGDDEYIAETAITRRDGVTQADWWHNAASFTVRNNQSTPHIVSPHITLHHTS